MQKLNLPDCALRLRHEEGNVLVFDIIRKKDVVLTPEEWVRQHFVHLLINHLKYPKTLINIESGLKYFQSDKRSDLLVRNRQGQPWLLVECKAPDVALQKEAVNQIATYNKVLNAPYIAITNGMSHFVWKLEKKGYMQMKEFPVFG